MFYKINIVAIYQHYFIIHSQKKYSILLKGYTHMIKFLKGYAHLIPCLAMNYKNNGYENTKYSSKDYISLKFQRKSNNATWIEIKKKTYKIIDDSCLFTFIYVTLYKYLHNICLCHRKIIIYLPPYKISRPNWQWLNHRGWL